MSKLCNNCGRELPDSVVNCTYCGNPVGGYQDNNNFGVLPNKSKIDTKMLLMIGGAAALVVIIVVALVLLLGGGAESACEDYLAVEYEGEVDNLAYLAPKDVISDLEDAYGVDLDDVKNYVEDDYKEEIKSLKKDIDPDVIREYEVLESEDVHEDVLSEIKKGLKDRYDISRGTVEDAKKCCYKIITEASDYLDVEYSTRYVVKIDGDWYPVTSSGKLRIESYFEDTPRNAEIDRIEEEIGSLFD